jgi:hypothetical protein
MAMDKHPSMFAEERTNMRRTFVEVYQAGRESVGLPRAEQRAHRRRTIQRAMNDLEHFTMQRIYGQS